jgi:WD repeat-containing protein 48
LRYLFSNLIDEEIKRDETFRAGLLTEKEETHPGRPTNITIPSMNINGWNEASSGPTSVSTIKANNGVHMPHTPGLAIGLATPMGHPQSAGRNSQHNPYLTPTTEEGSQLEKTQTQRSSMNGAEPDYFGQVTSATNGNANGNGKPAAAAPSEGATEAKEETVSSPTEPDTPAKKGKGMFGKKFGFNKKLFSTGTAVAEPVKPAVVDEKAEDSDSRSTKTDEKVFEDNFYGSIQKIRQIYEEELAAGATKLESQITPSLPSDTPVLKPPASTTILIQEDRPEAGGVADLFEGKVGSLGQQADLIEKVAPSWLAEVLLRVSPHPTQPLANTTHKFAKLSTECPPRKGYSQSILHPRTLPKPAPKHLIRRVPPLFHTLRASGES